MHQNFKNSDAVNRGSGGKVLLSPRGVTGSKIYSEYYITTARGAKPLWKLRVKQEYASELT